MKQISFRLKPIPPFRLDLTVWILRRRPDNAIDRWQKGAYHRILIVGKEPMEIAVRQLGPMEEPELEVTAAGPALPAESRKQLKADLERMLGTRVDLQGFYRLAGKDPPLKSLAGRFIGFKPPRFPTLFEALVNGIACQQITLTSGIRLLNRLVLAAGIPFGAGPERAFPRPEDLAVFKSPELRAMGFSTSKARALIDLADLLARRPESLGDLDASEDEAALKRLERLRGIGRWTAEYALLRGLGRLHIFPGKDSGALAKLKFWLGLSEPPDEKRLGRLLKRWHPYGGLVYFHLLLSGLADRQQIVLPPSPNSGGQPVPPFSA